MIELQNVWNEIEDQLDELDDQDVDFPERQDRSPQKLALDDFAYEAKLAISHAGGSLLSNERPPSADDNLLAQFLGDYAYELDRTREDEDSDASSVGSPLQDLSSSSSLFEDLLLSHPTTRSSNNVVRKESVAVPTFDYITQEPPVKGKSGLVVPASPSTPIIRHSDEDSSSPSPSKKRSSSEIDTAAKKRHCAPTIPTPVAAPTPTPTKRTYLLHLISNVLPAEKLAGVVEIVNETSYVQRVESEEEIELEFDINALDEVTLKRLEQYVESCLSFTRPKRTTSKAKRKESHSHSHSKRSGSRKRELRLSLESMGEVLTMKHGSLSDDESEDIDILG